MNKIELLAPAGSLANLKAAVSKGADAAYLGMKRFSARDFATNFNENFLREAVRICKSNNVRIYLAMNTLVKNNEIPDFFRQLSYAYAMGIDAVITQEISFLDIIRKNYPDLRVHISTQAGVMNSLHAKMLSKADRITLARELTKEEIKKIRENVSNELEIFCHGALCASVSGQCLFSSFLGGRSGNRGKCAQPCRKKYNGRYYLSTKELCLINKIPEIIGLGINSMKIEGRMRTPYYVATVTENYRKAIDGFYEGNFNVSNEMMDKLETAFSREFTAGWFSESKDIFNREKASGKSKIAQKEMYKVSVKDIETGREQREFSLPVLKEKKSIVKRLLVRVYNERDAICASLNGDDIVYYDLFAGDFLKVKKLIKCRIFAATPRIMPDSDINRIKERIEEVKPDGILAGNLGILNLGLKIPIHLDYNLNCFNDIDLDYFSSKDTLPIISPELSLSEIASFRNKNFIALVHGKLRLMTLRHDLEEGIIADEKGGKFIVNKVINGGEIINEKELGLLGKCSQLLKNGINNFYIDTDKDVEEIVRLYRKILDGKKADVSEIAKKAISEHAQEPIKFSLSAPDDSKLKKNYVLGWSYRGVK